MTDEKWEEITGRIKDTFTVDEEYASPLPDGPGTVRAIVFTTPNGKMKLEFISEPIILGTHAVGSKRIGSSSAVEYDYSDTETKNLVIAYRFVDGSWVEVNAEGLLAL